MLNDTERILRDVISLYDQYANRQIERIESQTDAELEALDTREQLNDDSLKKKNISEREAANTSKQLEAERVRIKAVSEKKINDIKRKQFNIDKAAALTQIAIDTAQAAAASLAQYPLPGGAPILALNLALAAAQAALVASEPNPYKLGTKASKEGLAVVGEEGPEQMLLPKGTKIIDAKKSKRYADVFDAIHDDRLDDYILKNYKTTIIDRKPPVAMREAAHDDRFEDYVPRNYITPELKKYKVAYQDEREQSLANNITKSMVINNMTNGKGDFYLERMSKKGMPISNLNDLADLITSNRTSPKRR